MNPTMNNTDAMKPCYPDFTTGTDNRNPDSYTKALQQFDVVGNPRYAVRGGNTYCNIFLWDGSRALGCEIPHFDLFYTKDSDGKIILSGHEHNANVVAQWFLTPESVAVGWKECSMDDAIVRAKQGHPTCIIWNNPGGIGHVGWVIPSSSAGCRIAQAGGINFFDNDYRKGFGGAAVKFYTHE